MWRRSARSRRCPRKDGAIRRRGCAIRIICPYIPTRPSVLAVAFTTDLMMRCAPYFRLGVATGRTRRGRRENSARRRHIRTPNRAHRRRASLARFGPDWESRSRSRTGSRRAVLHHADPREPVVSDPLLPYPRRARSRQRASQGSDTKKGSTDGLWNA
ncbi:hypothetical protein B0H21DRAFT_291167 [Amylocystis lapponica]|nr:hypothetical protein B0H21DRAFT_291167 [Amylocystis lapponica]